MKLFHYIVTNRLCHILSTIVIAILISTTCHAAKTKYIWQSSDQFVALEQQDSPSTNTVAPNDHPATVTSETISAMLSSLEIRATDSDKPEPLFTAVAVQSIAPQILQGLRQASPTEDVTFAVIGLHNTSYGFVKSHKVTTGRVYYQAGRLNILIGQAQKEVNDRDDRRLAPFTPGSRHKTSEGDWQLLPQPGQKGFSLQRKDWAAFSTEWQPPAAVQSVSPQQSIPAGLIAPARQPSPADRLIVLKELKEKGLISEEEYRSKRQEILNLL
ncbi:MAG: SHOCT domain-containing protein [Geobacteraceae bacterium]|nr:SHOCT domain-containing protein [Geobacteraceae bacterium]